MSQNKLTSLITTQESKFIISESIKNFFIYAVICATPPLILRLDINLRSAFISEHSVTEISQLILLLCSTALFFHIAYKIKDLKRACILIAGFFLVLFIRENDGLLDKVSHGFWFPIALIMTFLTITYFLLGKKDAFVQLAVLLKAPPMQLIIFSLTLLLVFSRLFGTGSLWRLVMQDNFVYDVKSMIEEGSELLAYILICFSSFKLNRYLFLHY